MNLQQILIPYVRPRSKCGVLSSLIQGGFNLSSAALTNGFNYKIAKDTNKANIQATKDTNETNAAIADAANQTNIDIANAANQTNIDIMREQNAFNENMWDKQNAYNTPEAQMQRLIEAGVNPNMVTDSLGGPAAGNASDSPTSSSFAGATPAHVNPVQLDAPHADPYSLIPFQADFLEPLAVAAGIRNTQADTKGKDIANEFAPQKYKDEHEMKAAMTQHFIESSKDLGETRQGRKMLLSAYKSYYNECENKMKEDLRMRKDEFEFAKSLRPATVAQIEANLQKTFKEIDMMDSSIVHQRALERHWINQDQIAQDLNDAQIQQIKINMKLGYFNAAVTMMGLQGETRESIINSFAKQGDTAMTEFFSGLKGAADGKFNNWFSAMWSQRGSVPTFLNDYNHTIFTDQWFIDGFVDMLPNGKPGSAYEKWKWRMHGYKTDYDNVPNDSVQ